MKDKTYLKVGDRIIIVTLSLLILLGLATACKDTENFKYDKPKFNISKVLSRCK
jgi:hypothetical protein